VSLFPNLLNYYVYLQLIRKTTNFNHDNLTPRQVLNSGHPEYEAEALTQWQTFFKSVGDIILCPNHLYKNTNLISLDTTTDFISVAWDRGNTKRVLVDGSAKI
jgi:hypothetical protein